MLLTLVLLAAPAGLSADQCVDAALEGSAQVAEARAKVRGWRARLAEVEAIHYPKLAAIHWVAPMFTVTGSALDKDVERDYGRWGPYTHLQAQLAWPIYAFGRISEGEDAAKHRALVEEAQVRVVRNTVALEVRKLYYLHLYARSMLPSLDLGLEALDGAIEQAQEMYAEGSGDVTQADIAKLQYGHAELIRLRRVASDGAELALSALKHAMGRPESEPLVLAEERLPTDIDAPPTLAESLRAAAEGRPEWDQLNHGERAALSLASAESLTDAPARFVAGQIEWNYAPTRDDTDNPYHYDPYNDVFGGVALGLKWDFDPAASRAKVEGAAALQDEVAALRRFAATGIPLQVRKAHQALVRHGEMASYTQKGEKAARKWMTFAGAAYRTGTGEARDVLEGLVAFLQAKNTRYETLRDYHVARAELLYATGRGR